MPVLIEHCYVTKDSQILGGEPIIRETRTPVRIRPEEIPTRLPHLTLAQVFDALSYYSDHQEEIHRHIERNRVPEDKIDSRVKGM
jgi:uncharacterized protein (DUF433 family)